jgi:hypothetical protein
MSKRKSFTPVSRKPLKRKPAPLSVRPGGIVDCVSRWRAEIDGITSALVDAPALDRDALSREQYPYNPIASSEPMRKALFRIVERRCPDSPWLDVFNALERADRTGKDFAGFMDAYRDAVFMAGVEYAQRSLPSWWAALNSLPGHKKDALAAIIEYSARHIADDGQGGAR